MRCLKFVALAGLAMGASILSPAVHAVPTYGVGAQSGALYNDNYHLGYGISGSMGALGMGGMSQVDLKANYLNYQSRETVDPDYLNEGGVGVTALIGPNTMLFRPMVGGHIGYTRFESGNFFDVGPDISATFKLTPQVGLNAALIPTWLINDNGNDYRTRASLGVQWSPGV